MPPVEVRVFCDANKKSQFNDWLKTLKKKQKRGYQKCVFLLAVLSREGGAMKMPLSKPLRNGIRELRGRVGTVNYRPLYALMNAGKAVMAHGLTKEGEVPSAAIDLALARVELAHGDMDTYTDNLKK